MGLGLADHLSYCVASNRVIFLDHRSQRYFCLGPLAERAVFTLLEGATPIREEEQALEALLAQGVLVPGGAELASQGCGMRLPRTELLPSVSPSLARCLQALWTLLLTMLWLRMGRLGILLGRFRTSKRRRCRRDPAPGSLAAIQAGYERTRLILSPENQCLPRSIALATTLARAGHRPDLVFGVMARPFAAHCWVQLDGVVLNDRVDHVGSFTPILVI